MHVATMEYPLLPETTATAAALWKSLVLEAAQGREGLVRLQLYSQPSRLLAVGTWQDKSFAEAFMRTGVFQNLKEALAPYLAADPQPRLWQEEAFLVPGAILNP